jgi:hypothetical protein
MEAPISKNENAVSHDPDPTAGLFRNGELAATGSHWHTGGDRLGRFG